MEQPTDNMKAKAKTKHKFTYCADNDFKKHTDTPTLTDSQLTHREHTHTHAHRASGTTWLISQLLPTFNLLLCNSGPVFQYVVCVCVCVWTEKATKCNLLVAFFTQAQRHVCLTGVSTSFSLSCLLTLINVSQYFTCQQWNAHLIHCKQN